MAKDDLISILVAEDNPGDVFLIRRAFQMAGVPHEMALARDGAEALELVKEVAQGKRPADLILLDLNLPRHDGAEVLAAVRKQDTTKSTPVILLTSSDSPVDHELCMKLGASHYFRKPSELQAFMALAPLAMQLVEDRPSY
jgi:CheY-like chemotaxis protein